MNKIIKHSINYFGLILTLSAMLFWGCSCNTSKPTPNPLVGWKLDSETRPSDQIIINDYQDYIQNLLPKGPKITGPVQFYKDDQGQHAVIIEVFVHNENASWSYILIYDKDNKRIKEIKYRYNKYQS